jgi:hypothetical protein
MSLYNLHLTKNELEQLISTGRIIIQDKIETDCDNCSEEICYEIQIIVDDK